MPAPETPKLRVSNFEKSVLEIVATKKTTFIDAVLIYCQDNQVDPDYVKSLMTGPIKSKLEAEFKDLNMIVKDNELEFDE